MQIKVLGRLGMALAIAAVVLASGLVDAAASGTWSPQNAVGKGSGTMTLTDNKNNWARCQVSFYLEAPTSGNASVAHTTDVNGNAGPPTFSSCTSNLSTVTSATCSTPWDFTAVSTTSVDMSNMTCTYDLQTIGTCTIGYTNVSLPNNTWNNSTGQLTINSADSFPISESGVCDGATSAAYSGVLTITGLTIT